MLPRWSGRNNQLTVNDLPDHILRNTEEILIDSSLPRRLILSRSQAGVAQGLVPVDIVAPTRGYATFVSRLRIILTATQY